MDGVEFLVRLSFSLVPLPTSFGEAAAVGCGRHAGDAVKLRFYRRAAKRSSKRADRYRLSSTKIGTAGINLTNWVSPLRCSTVDFSSSKEQIAFRDSLRHYQTSLSTSGAQMKSDRKRLH